MKKNEHLKELFEAKKAYAMELNEKHLNFSKQLKSEFQLFTRNPANKNFVINEKGLSLQEFTLLLGNDRYNSAGLNLGWFYRTEADQKKTFKEVEDYLRSIPGMVMPEVPEILKDWLEEKD